MIQRSKDFFFFPVASYFAFWAKIRLNKWNPRVIVVTGSSGKTTLFSMIESQVKNRAHFSHHANSAIGVPFDILDLHRKTLKPLEWISLFFKAPIHAFKEPYKEKLYIAECDADRPGEAKFLSKLLKPEVTLWISSSRTHSMNFDKLVNRHSGNPALAEDSRIPALSAGRKSDPGQARMTFPKVEDAIAYEFGNFLEKTSNLVIINGDSELMQNQEKRTKAKIEKVSLKNLDDYKISREGTDFKIGTQKIHLKSLQPKEIFYSIEMSRLLCEYLGIEFDPTFKKFSSLPGRSSLFRGIKNITIIDSTYNANLSSMTAVLSMFDSFQAKEKWLVIGDMLELGKEEQKEHEKLAEVILSLDVKRIVLLGPRTNKYVYPILVEKLEGKTPVDSFENPKEVLDFLLQHIQGHETILFKGARFLEGVVEHLLLDTREKHMLVRRELVWEERRRKWGL